uniref:Uncharacterized protein n=1 Tax=Pseudo-nitzschia australis TaxID=44445 RepID=A0A7S4ADQ1_9STRA|mmetsp:Transcript_15454/g.32062  ORF Transcript_15454/g.32062 Transcript_15454/m.32062 type:complete len:195 (+) Transcript_15454:400-984(+)
MSTASCNSNSSSNDSDSSTKPSSCASTTKAGRIFRKSIGTLTVDVDDGSENVRSSKFFGEIIRDPDQQPSKRKRATPDKDGDDNCSDLDLDLDQPPSKRKRVTLDEDSDDNDNGDNDDGDDVKPKRIFESAGNGKSIGKCSKTSLAHDKLPRDKYGNRISAESDKSSLVRTVSSGLERRSSVSPRNDVFHPAMA